VPSPSGDLPRSWATGFEVLNQLLGALRQWNPEPCTHADPMVAVPDIPNTGQNYYDVVWKHRVYADSPYEAARDARALMLRTGTHATEFEVTYHADGCAGGVPVTQLVDLSEPAGDPWWTVISLYDSETGKLLVARVMPGQRIAFDGSVLGRCVLRLQYVQAASWQEASQSVAPDPT
jgi:hypothetical protein